MAVVYKITRSDDQEYVGIAANFKNRLASHKLSDRFSIGISKYEILYEGKYVDCWNKEEEYITIHDTFYNGLNRTKSGKGGNPKPMLGFKFSEESKCKMSESKKNYVPWNLGKKYSFSEDVRQRRKGKMCSSKLTKEQVLTIRNQYENRVDVDEYNALENKIAKNGIPITYEIFFTNKHASKYGLTTTGFKNILRRKAWPNV